MPTVAIIHGWAEGEWQSRQFRQQLIDNGFSVSSDIKSADIIFAHSSGCFLVPPEVKAKTIILVGPPYWPHRHLATSVLTKLFKEVTVHRHTQPFSWWLNKLAHNLWYIIANPQASLRVITDHKLTNLPSPSRHQVILIRPADDTFTHPNIQKLLADQNYTFITLPGAHDDCWLDSQTYIDLIKNLINNHKLQTVNSFLKLTYPPTS